MLISGEVFAGFTVERLLGQGGMGSVYLARHPRLSRLTALKLLNRDLFLDNEVRARFEREADLAAQLDHPSIVAVYDRGSEDGQLWISMQYVDGVDAAAVNPMTLPPERAVQIVEGVADALDYAHGMGVLHRDVKPANIMLARSSGGQGERVFLTDFGIARLREDSTHLTQTGMFTATLAYASPEQMTGAPLGNRSDQYSLACALYWLLAGVGPFDSANPADIINGHLQLPLPSIRLRRPNLNPALDAVLAAGMAKRPEHRYRSCAEFAAAARKALTAVGPPPLPVLPPPAYAPQPYPAPPGYPQPVPPAPVRPMPPQPVPPQPIPMQAPHGLTPPPPAPQHVAPPAVPPPGAAPLPSNAPHFAAPPVASPQQVVPVPPSASQSAAPSGASPQQVVSVPPSASQSAVPPAAPQAVSVPPNAPQPAVPPAAPPQAVPLPANASQSAAPPAALPQAVSVPANAPQQVAPPAASPQQAVSVPPSTSQSAVPPVAPPPQAVPVPPPGMSPSGGPHPMPHPPGVPQPAPSAPVPSQPAPTPLPPYASPSGAPVARQDAAAPVPSNASGAAQPGAPQHLAGPVPPLPAEAGSELPPTPSEMIAPQLPSSFSEPPAPAAGQQVEPPIASAHSASIGPIVNPGTEAAACEGNSATATRPTGVSPSTRDAGTASPSISERNSDTKSAAAEEEQPLPPPGQGASDQGAIASGPGDKPPVPNSSGDSPSKDIAGAESSLRAAAAQPGAGAAPLRDSATKADAGGATKADTGAAAESSVRESEVVADDVKSSAVRGAMPGPAGAPSGQRAEDAGRQGPAAVPPLAGPPPVAPPMSGPGNGPSGPPPGYPPHGPNPGGPQPRRGLAGLFGALALGLVVVVALAVGVVIVVASRSDSGGGTAAAPATVPPKAASPAPAPDPLAASRRAFPTLLPQETGTIGEGYEDATCYAEKRGDRLNIDEEVLTSSPWILAWECRRDVDNPFGMSYTVLEYQSAAAARSVVDALPINAATPGRKSGVPFTQHLWIRADPPGPVPSHYYTAKLVVSFSGETAHANYLVYASHRGPARDERAPVPPAEDELADWWTTAPL
ncbi:serine/threonine-protein kinase [Nocardia amikacinitolerans]|uniref:serine/threonine-protein kinase n=1 Tax=Nocardia amikacinitolerans TaxID=756689 RepID=UPI0020A3D7B7|nr:serine/threonine protein kinase [Nocardia amikacinitolerans]MCP2287347.1 Serine/threonine protein kinase [Nocardia amikacinitolerans]